MGSTRWSGGWDPTVTIWWNDIHSLPWKDTPMLLTGKPTISIRAIEKPWRTVSHTQRVHQTEKKLNGQETTDLSLIVLFTAAPVEDIYHKNCLAAVSHERPKWLKFHSHPKMWWTYSVIRCSLRSNLESSHFTLALTMIFVSFSWTCSVCARYG